MGMTVKRSLWKTKSGELHNCVCLIHDNGSIACVIELDVAEQVAKEILAILLRERATS